MKVVKRPMAFSDALLKYQGIAEKEQFYDLKKTLRLQNHNAIIFRLIDAVNHSEYTGLFCKFIKMHFDTFELILQLVMLEMFKFGGKLKNICTLYNVYRGAPVKMMTMMATRLGLSLPLTWLRSTMPFVVHIFPLKCNV